MKRYYSMVAFAAAALVLAGCSAEESVKPIEEETPEATKTIRITAMMPGSDTRVSIGDATGSSEEPTYPVNWNVGDKIYLLGVGKDGIGNNGGNDCFLYKGTLTLKSGAGTSSAVFEGEVNPTDLSEIKVAAYGSYDWAKAYTPNVFKVTINDNITDPDKIDSPMIATGINLTENATIKFSHLAGAIRFDIKNLPTDAAKLQLSTIDSNNDHPQISKNFGISVDFTKLDSWKPVLNVPHNIADQYSGGATTIKLRDNKDGVYCFVLPVYTSETETLNPDAKNYKKGFGLKILDVNGKTLLKKGSSEYTIRDSREFTINAGDIALYHTIDCDTIIKSGTN